MSHGGVRIVLQLVQSTSQCSKNICVLTDLAGTKYLLNIHTVTIAKQDICFIEHLHDVFKRGTWCAAAWWWGAESLRSSHSSAPSGCGPAWPCPDQHVVWGPAETASCGELLREWDGRGSVEKARISGRRQT